MWGTNRKRLRTVTHLVASRPHVIVIPLLVFGLMIGVGVWATLLGAQSSAEAAKIKATSQARSTASSMVLSIQNAIGPAVAIADWVKHTRELSVILAQWSDRLPDWFARASNVTLTAQIAPGGWLNMSWPPLPSAGNPTRTDFDTLNTSISTYPDQVLASMRDDKVLALGPFPSDVPGVSIMAFQLPIFVPNVSESQLFGTRKPTQCPPETCYNTATRTRWWGFVTTFLNAGALLKDASLAHITEAGYGWQIQRSPLAYSHESEWSNVDVYSQALIPADTVMADLPVADQVWRLYVWQDNWEPVWKVPVIIGVVLGSLVCSGLVFAVLLSWQEHQLLLESILPKEAITRMREDMQWDKSPETGLEHLRMVQFETPAQHMLTILRAVLAGDTPPVSLVVAVQQALQRSQDVYRPTNQEFQSTLRQVSNMDDEVQAALVAQLAGRTLEHTESMAAEGEPYKDACAPAKPQVLVFKAPPPDSTGQDTLQQKQDPEASIPAVHQVVFASNGSSQVAVRDGIGELETHLSMMCRGQPVVAGGGFAALARVQESATLSMVAEQAPDVLLPHQHVPHPTLALPDQLDLVLATANTWQFDAYALEEASNGHPLSVLGYWLMHTSGCTAYARMDGAVLARFLQRVEAGYRRNPYHNSRHAADVLQTFHMILQHSGLKPGYVDQLTLLGCYLAAIVHDYEHLGRTNDYLVTTHDKLAFRYNDKSPMENHHLAAAWELLRQPEHNCLAGLTKAKWEKLRRLVIELVLATDMRQHFAILGQFKTVFPAKSAQPSSRISLDVNPARPSVRSVSSMDEGSRASACSSASTTRQVTEADKLLALQVALKCSDLGHLTAPLDVHLKWVSALEEELFLQGDAERAAGLPISPLCDRGKEGVTKSQVGFLEIVVLPTFSAFCGCFTATRPLLQAVSSNYQYWKSKAFAQSNRRSDSTTDK